MVHHQCKKWIGHRVQRSAELGAEVIAIAKPKAHGDTHFAKIRRNATHANAGAEKGRPQVHAELQQARGDLARHADQFISESRRRRGTLS
jgi:hypothetical protein